KECRLVTYAAYWVRAEIREFVVRSYRIVRLGTTKAERRALRAYRKTRETDAGVLSQMSGLGPDATERLLPVLCAHDASLDQPNAFGAALVDRLASRAISPEDQIVANDHKTKTRAEVDAFLRDLSPRERVILSSRWLRDDPVTLEALGRRFGISKERVRQLEE